MITITAYRARMHSPIILGNLNALWKEGEISLLEFKTYQELFKDGLKENDMSAFQTELVNQMAFLPNKTRFKNIIENL